MVHVKHFIALARLFEWLSSFDAYWSESELEAITVAPAGVTADITESCDWHRHVSSH